MYSFAARRAIVPPLWKEKSRFAYEYTFKQTNVREPCQRYNMPLSNAYGVKRCCEKNLKNVLDFSMDAALNRLGNFYH